MNNYTFSIIIPCFNASLFIEDTLKSILIQKENNIPFEIILINDKSSDNTLEILNQYQNKYPDIIKIINNIDNNGVSYSRNRGIEQAEGSYILFLDADDCYINGLFKKLSTIIQSNKSIDLISFAYKRNGGDNKSNSVYINPEYNNRLFLKDDFVNLFLKKQIYQNICSIAISKDLLLNNNIFFDEHTTLGEDIVFQIKCMIKSTTIYYISDVFFQYNYNPNSVTNKKYTYGHLSCINNFGALKKFILDINKNTLLSELIFYYQYMFFYELRYFLKSNDNTLIKEYLKSDKILKEKPYFYFLNKSSIMLYFMKLIYRISPKLLFKII